MSAKGQTRRGGLKDRLDALLDGTLTAEEIAAILDCRSEYVRSTVARQGWQGRLRPARAAAPVAPADEGPTRAEDDRELRWLADRVVGKTLRDIARRDRTGSSFVQTRTSAIRDADLAESGEPPLVVGRAYAWPRPCMPVPGGRE